LDEPFSRSESRAIGVRPLWPADFENYAHAAVPMRQALALSMNAATARLAVDVGLPGVIETAKRLGLGIGLPVATTTPPLAMALGGGMTVVPIDITAAYAPFFNGGRRAESHGIIMVVGQDGNVASTESVGPGAQVMTPPLAGVMSDMLHDVVKYGTGWRANPGHWAAGKTGTTQHNDDAWFVGFDRQDALLTSIWIGNDDNTPMRRDVSGGTLPAEAWRRFNRGIGGPEGQSVIAVR
jgi:penicillin-binding protein 1A